MSEVTSPPTGSTTASVDNRSTEAVSVPSRDSSTSDSSTSDSSTSDSSTSDGARFDSSTSESATSGTTETQAFSVAAKTQVPDITTEKHASYLPTESSAFNHSTSSSVTEQSEMAVEEENGVINDILLTSTTDGNLTAVNVTVESLANGTDGSLLFTTTLQTKVYSLNTSAVIGITAGVCGGIPLLVILCCCLYACVCKKKSKIKPNRRKKSDITKADLLKIRQAKRTELKTKLDLAQSHLLARSAPGSQASTEVSEISLRGEEMRSRPDQSGQPLSVSNGTKQMDQQEEKVKTVTFDTLPTPEKPKKEKRKKKKKKAKDDTLITENEVTPKEKKKKKSKRKSLTEDETKDGAKEDKPKKKSKKSHSKKHTD